MKTTSIGRLAVVLAAALAACGPDEPAEPPEPLFGSAEIEFPVELWDQGIEGEAVVMVRVLASGAADSVYIADSSGHAAFDSAAAAGARSLRYSPGRRGERRIDMWARLPVRFALDGGPALGVVESVDESTEKASDEAGSSEARP